METEVLREHPLTVFKHKASKNLNEAWSKEPKQVKSIVLGFMADGEVQFVTLYAVKPSSTQSDKAKMLLELDNFFRLDDESETQHFKLMIYKAGNEMHQHASLDKGFLLKTEEIRHLSKLQPVISQENETSTIMKITACDPLRNYYHLVFISPSVESRTNSVSESTALFTSLLR